MPKIGIARATNGSSTNVSNGASTSGSYYTHYPTKTATVGIDLEDESQKQIKALKEEVAKFKTVSHLSHYSGYVFTNKEDGLNES